MATIPSPHKEPGAFNLLHEYGHRMLLTKYGRCDHVDYRRAIEKFRFLKAVICFTLKIVVSAAVTDVAEDDFIDPIRHLVTTIIDGITWEDDGRQLIHDVVSQMHFDVRAYYALSLMARPVPVERADLAMPAESTPAGLTAFLREMTKEIGMQAFWNARLLPRPDIEPHIYLAPLYPLWTKLQTPEQQRDVARATVKHNLDYQHPVLGHHRDFPEWFLCNHYRPGL